MKDARTILDLEHGHLAFAAHRELRDGEPPDLGEERTAKPGDVLFQVGNQRYPLIAILEGEVAILDAGGREIVRHRREVLQRVEGLGVEVVGPHSSASTRQMLDFLRASRRSRGTNRTTTPLRGSTKQISLSWAGVRSRRGRRVAVALELGVGGALPEPTCIKNSSVSNFLWFGLLCLLRRVDEFRTIQ